MSAPATAEAAVTEYRPLVTKIAGHIARRLPRCVEFDDLVQAGLEGLMDARVRYDGDQGAAFATYAGIRIRGAILDQIRQGDWAPRSVHRAGRDIAKAIAAVEGEVGRDARAEEVAERLGLEIEEYRRLLGDVDSARIRSLDAGPDQRGSEPGAWGALAPAARVASPDVTPEEALDGAQREEALHRAIKSLPERERLIIEATYLGDQNLREVGAMLGVSESRVCQLRTQAEARLRARLEGIV